MHYLRILIVFGGLIAYIPLQSQEIVRSTIGSAGSAAFNGGILLRYTVGQPPGTEVFSDYLMILRQGFQQAIDHPSVTSAPLVPQDLLKPGPGFAMYPNPARNHVNIVFDDTGGPFELYITSIYGQRVYHSKDLKESRTTLNLQSLIPGIYFVTATSGGERSTHKLIVL